MRTINRKNSSLAIGGMLSALLILSVNLARAQETRVSFPSARMEVAVALKTIEQQTGYLFSYQGGTLNVSSWVAFTRRNLPVQEAVKQILAGKNLDFVIHKRYIIIHRVAASTKPSSVVEDIYRSTDPRSVDASPLHRPYKEKSESTGIPEIPVPVTEPSPILPPAYSSYYPLENYIRSQAYLPSIALKTNLLYAIGTLTPNLGIEFGIGSKTTLQFSGSYNPWNRIGTLENNNKLVHWVVRPEFRYWFCDRFNGHFAGANTFYNQFNISGKNIPFVNFKKDFRYEGYAWGAGINYGYHLLLAGRWGLEFSAGAGVARMKYDVFDCLLCSGVQEKKARTWFGPTHASISLVFMIR